MGGYLMARKPQHKDENSDPTDKIRWPEDIRDQKKLIEKFRDSEEKYRTIFDQTAVGISYNHIDGKFININKRFCEILGYSREELLKLGVVEISNPQDLVEERKLMEKVFSGQVGIHKMEKRFIRKNKTEIWCRVTVALERNSAGEPKYCIGVLEDITEYKKFEVALQQAHSQLEQRVKDRTKELEIQKSKLEEINVALNVLLEKRVEDKAIMQEQVLSNVKKLALPYIEKLKKSGLSRIQKVLADAIESGLYEIVAPFSLKLSSVSFGLTPAEIIVADLIRQGKSTKEISTICNLSPKTIDHHRERIRKKLGIKNKKINLHSHLDSFS
jgi:PAS domain S-box-containing protein